jgi:GST-like protein
MAAYPWIVPHKRQGQNLDDFPNLKRWHQAIWDRPATKRAYEKGKAVHAADRLELNDQTRKVLFGQSAKTVRG